MDETDFNQYVHDNLTVGEKLKKLFNVSNQPRLIVSINGGLLEDTSLTELEKKIFQKDLEKVCVLKFFYITQSWLRPKVFCF